MAFDLTTAKPVQKAGFNASTARPVAPQQAGQEQVSPELAALRKSQEAQLAERMAAIPGAKDISPLGAAAIGAGRGITTIGRGLGLVDPETEQDRQAFQELEKESPIATTIGEIAGESAPFLVPGLGVAGLTGRTLQVLGTAALGAAEGGLISRGKGGDTGEQLATAGISGTAAGALELALPRLGRIGGKIIRRVLGKAPEGAVVDAAGNPSDELLEALAETGQTFDDVVDEARSELLKQPVDPKQAARKAFLVSQGLKPTRAQMTRNAADFQAQQESAKTAGRARNALEAQEAALTTRFDNEILKAGGQANSPVSTVADALTEKATRLDQEISDLYATAKQVIPEDKNVKFSALANELKKLAPSDRRAGGNISALVGDLKSKGILDDKMNVVGRVDVETAEDIRKLTNELYDPANPFGNMLLRKVKDKLDDDVFRAAGEDFFKQGREAKSAFEKELSRSKISKFDSRKSNLVRDILENKIDPDKMVDKVVFSKKWRPDDLKQLKDYISTDEVGKKAFNDLRSEVLQEIKERSFIGAEDADGFKALSRDKLSKAIDSIGEKKLGVLFEPKEIKFLKDMLAVSKIREPVRGTALGRGPSAQAIARLEQKLKDLPIIGSLVNFINLDAQGRAVIKAKPERVVRETAPSQIRGALPAPAVAATQQEQEE